MLLLSNRVEDSNEDGEEGGHLLRHEGEEALPPGGGEEVTARGAELLGGCLEHL